MEKLLELEKRLREAKAELEKAGGRFTGMQGSVATSGGPSIASQIGFGKKEDDKEDKKDKKHMDEKEDKKLIAKEIDKHNEKKHGEPKDKDSAYEDMDIKKGERQSAMVYTQNDPKGKEVSPEEQVRMKRASMDAKAAKVKADAGTAKAKGEAEAAARRMAYRKEGVLKADDMCKSDESISFNEWGQWNL